uniref:RRM domain-containing protein n=1 Tax=Oryza meridionalis TaxID=40149 RepID=A0A0E0CJQ8_9ORYZ
MPQQTSHFAAARKGPVTEDPGGWWNIPRLTSSLPPLPLFLPSAPFSLSSISTPLSLSFVVSSPTSAPPPRGASRLAAPAPAPAGASRGYTRSSAFPVPGCVVRSGGGGGGGDEATPLRGVAHTTPPSSPLDRIDAMEQREDHTKSSVPGKEREYNAQPKDDMFPLMKQPGTNARVADPMDDVAQHLIGNLLPDDEELLAGVIEDFDHVKLRTQVEESEEYDVFRNSGGMELDVDPLESITFGTAKASLVNGTGSSTNQYSIQNGAGTPFGDIRSMYTATKHRGFVMISYYDIRHARNAKTALQNKPLRRRKLDIHYSIPKENPSDKDMNQGTLVIFNLEPAVSNEELLQIFGAFGEVREIRETPHKRHHRFIEFYDVRAAESALRSLNKSDIAGKRVKLEPSRPGGARRSFIQHFNHEFEQDETKHNSFQIGSPSANSPPSLWSQLGSPTDENKLNALNETAFNGGMSPLGSNHLSGFSSGYPPMKSPVGKSSYWNNRADNIFHGSPTLHNSHSFPEHHGGIISASPLVSSAASSASTASGFTALTGTSFLWGNNNNLRDHGQPSSIQSQALSNSLFPNNQPQRQSNLYQNLRGSFGASEHFSQFNVGSAPSVFPFESNFGYFSDSPDTSYMRQGKFGGTGPTRVGGSLMTNFGAYPRINVASMQNGSVGFEGLLDRGRNQTVGNSGCQEDSRVQYQLDLENIIAVIDETHEGTYDFFYLPIDFKNKCNVGYAFINMASPGYIVSFFKAFAGRKWEKFNSEKVVSLAYARIQGKAALVNHFQNSSLMNEDKRCRPMLFDPKHTENNNQILLNRTFISMAQQDATQERRDLPENPREDNFS